MTPTLVPHQPQRARDWAEVQERMLVPLYEAVHDRLEVGPQTHLLDLGCGSGLALLLAAARGATVTGVEADETRLALARERLSPGPGGGRSGWDVTLVRARPEDVPLHAPRPTVVTAFDRLPGPGALAGLAESLDRGTPVVLAGWGPPERCAAASVLRVAARIAESPPDGLSPVAAPGSWQQGGRDDLEVLARTAGLRLDGSGRVSCPFGYADPDSAVRGLLSTGLYDAALRDADEDRVREEIHDALAPHRRGDGTVWMPNLFRYVVARV